MKLIATVDVRSRNTVVMFEVNETDLILHTPDEQEHEARLRWATTNKISDALLVMHYIAKKIEEQQT